MMLSALTLALLAGVAMASCPNDCSGNGECNIYSACECHRNWMGADCSERVCYFGVAFVDTPQGDLNADGFVSDTTYKTRFSNTPTWEIYPTYAGWGSVNYQWGGIESGAYSSVTVTGDSGGEAHFYKECSAKGTCDRSSGLCQCFDGYEGAGCTRVACLNGCSGHGHCRTITELMSADPAWHSGADFGSFKYSAWDADVSQSCVCEPGYTGLDCSLRMCPKGDDPVTKFESYTKITFKKTTSTTNHDLGATPCTSGTDGTCSTQGAEDAATTNKYDSANPMAAAGQAYDNPWGFTDRIWAHPVTPQVTGSSSDFDVTLNDNGLAWNPWYSVGDNKPPVARGSTQPCHYEDKYMCETYGVKHQTAALMKLQAAFKYDLVVTGTMSGARGVQRRVPMGLYNDTSTLMAPGCCYYQDSYRATGTDRDVNCEECDFFSLYLTDVEGEFQLGDRIQISWDDSGSGDEGAETIYNAIESVDTHYNTHRLQHQEEQVLKIKFPDYAVSAKMDETRFQGFISLTFTDEFGDEYTTEAISVSVAGACNPSLLNGTAASCLNGITASSDVTTDGYTHAEDAANDCDDWATGHPDYTDESLHGDFVIHRLFCADMDSSNNKRYDTAGDASTVTPGAYYAHPHEAGPQDFKGGWAVAEAIEKALEALPNHVTGDVQVEYAYNAADATGGTYNEQQAASSTVKTNSALERFFVIRFMEAGGDIPELKVNYAFSAGGKMYTNQACGAVGELVAVIDPMTSTEIVRFDTNAPGVEGGSNVTVYFDPAGVVCEDDPVVTAQVQEVWDDAGQISAGAIYGFTIHYPGKGCKLLSAGDNPDGTVDLFFPSYYNASNAWTWNEGTDVVGVFSQVLPTAMNMGDTSDMSTSNIISCMAGATSALMPGAESTSRFGGDMRAYAVVTQTATTTTVDTTSDDSETLTHFDRTTDLYNSTHLWGRDGVTRGLGFRGTTEGAECSSRGLCDHASGVCQCFAGFSSKNCATHLTLV